LVPAVFFAASLGRISAFSHMPALTERLPYIRIEQRFTAAPGFASIDTRTPPVSQEIMEAGPIGE
jgi:hypothetical protein